jgi:prepilin-type N-terminal cleavage/methylation domain-containing protein
MKKAFTMLELIMVIVVIGILAAVIIPRTASNDTAEAAVKLLSDIRYTQHLAMVDDKYDANNATWYEDIWQMRFVGNSYSIVSDNNSTFAKDPSDISKEIKNIDLNEQFGVTLTGGGGCTTALAGGIMGFDHIGRPIINDLTGTGTAYLAANLLSSDCTITISGSAANVVIRIRPETGYASID